MAVPATNDARCPVCRWRLEDERANADIALSPGTSLAGRYRIGRVLQRGPTGILYLAFDTVAVTRVAIREYYPAGVCTRDHNGESVVPLPGRDRVCRSGMLAYVKESRLARTLQTPHIAAPLGRVLANNTVYSVFPWTESEFLSERATTACSVDGSNATMLAANIFRAVDALHSFGLAHGTLETEAFRIGEGGMVQLMDLGLVRRCLAGMSVGTVADARFMQADVRAAATIVSGLFDDSAPPAIWAAVLRSMPVNPGTRSLTAAEMVQAIETPPRAWVAPFAAIILMFYALLTIAWLISAGR